MNDINIKEFEMIVKDCFNNKQISRKSGMARDTVKKYIKLYNIDTSHFKRVPLPRIREKRICPICKKEFECIHCSKKRFCSTSCGNRNRKLPQVTKNNISNKLKKYYTENSLKIEKMCPICNKKFLIIKSFKDKIYCSKKCYLNDKGAHFRKRAGGGYRKGSGRSKSGYYKGMWCDSTYELIYIIYCLDHNIPIERNKEKFEYEYNNKTHFYYPDFIVDNSFIEIKGYYTDLVDIKASAVASAGHDIKILYRQDLQKQFNYVFSKYNVNVDYLHTLYDNHKPKFVYKCQVCNTNFESLKEKKTKKYFCSRKCTGLGLHIK